MRLRCDECEIQIFGVPVRYANRNFCTEKCQGDWSDRQGRKTRRTFECPARDANDGRQFELGLQEVPYDE